MMSTTFLIALGVDGTAVILALIVRWRRLPAASVAGHAQWRDASYTSLLLSVAASIGLARTPAGHSSDGRYGWHGSHLDHGGHSLGGGFTEGSYGGGGDGGGGAGL